MSDAVAVKRALARLATGPPSEESPTDSAPTDSALPDSPQGDERVVRRAERALADVEMAAGFVAEGGVARLQAAVERTGRGAKTLAAFERYRRVARGDQLHSGHVTDLSAGPKEVPD